MKTVFSSHAGVCHAFNQQNQYEGRASRIFFYGTKIYSYGYHYLLGEFIEPGLILINDQGYSHSTSKHIYHLIDATRDKEQIFTTHSELNLVLNELERLYNKLIKARKPRRYYYDLMRLHNRFTHNTQRLGGFFVSNNLNSEFTLISLDNICKDHQEKLNRINELVRLADEYKQSETYERKEKRAQELEATKAEREKAKRDAQQKELRQKRADLIAKFYSHEISRPGFGLSYDLLRVSKCGQYIETSQEVKIPIDEARRYYKLFKSGAYMRGEKVGQYMTLSNDGYLKIGCHNISHDEANKIGELILNN